MRIALFRRVLATLALVLMLLVSVSCGDDGGLPAGQVITKGSAAIATVTSFHFVFEAAKPGKPIPGLFVSRADGTAARPDKLSATVDATMAGFSVKVQAIVDGQNQYMTDPVTGKWSKQSSALNVMQYFDPSKGASEILGSVKNPKSDGRESVDGVDCYRLKGSVPAAALQSLTSEVSTTADLTTTLWIASGDFLLRRATLAGPISPAEPESMSRTLTFSEYNKPVMIETPVVGQ